MNNPKIVVIEDDVQAYFECMNSKADYSFTSLRKWFPCPDGAFVKSKKEMHIKLSVTSLWSQDKLAGNLLKNYSNMLDDSIALELISKGEKLLDQEYISQCNEVSSIIFSNLEIREIAEKRKVNANYLHHRLIDLGVEHLYSEKAIPFFVPIYVNGRDKLRKLFFANRIYTPVHWPKASAKLNGENELYSQELSLICDQRYDIDDMENQIKILKQFLDSEDE